MMKLIVASVVAAAAAYLGNRALFRVAGGRAAVTMVPWWEELAKLCAAFVAGPRTPMLFVHLIFGALEFAYDLWRGRNDGLYLGLLTLAGHGLFGSVAMLTADYLGTWWWAYLAAGLLHMVYNAAVVYLVLPTLGAGINRM